MALGSSFGVTPAGLEEQAQRAKKRLPTQQALQTLSLQLPKTLGADTTAPSSMMSGAYRPGGIPDSADAQMARMVRAMGGFKAGSSRPSAPPRFTQTQSSRAPQPVPTPRPPAAVKPPTRQALAPGEQRDAPQRPRSGLTGSRDPRKTQAAKPVNPSQVGGGLVDPITSPPPTQGAPPQGGFVPSYGPGMGGPRDGSDDMTGGFVYNPATNSYVKPGFTRAPGGGTY
jgi:hypothetical protein